MNTEQQYQTLINFRCMVDQIKLIIAIQALFNIQGRFLGFNINVLNRFEDSQTFFLDENYLLFDHKYYYDWIQKWVAATIYLLNANTSFVISGARFFFSLKISVASTCMFHFVCSIFLYATVSYHGCQTTQLDIPRSYALLISIELFLQFTFFYILASLSISRVFSRVFQADENPPTPIFRE